MDESRTLTPKFWLWRCDNCGLLAYPPDDDQAAEPLIGCPCWKGPRWVRYFAISPSTPESRDAARRARAAEAVERPGVSTVDLTESRLQPDLPRPGDNGRAITPTEPHQHGSDREGQR